MVSDKHLDVFFCVLNNAGRVEFVYVVLWVLIRVLSQTFYVALSGGRGSAQSP